MLEWRKSTTWFSDFHPFFVVIFASESGYAWYLVNDEEHELVASGSDDTLQAAKMNAEDATHLADVQASGETS